MFRLTSFCVGMVLLLFVGMSESSQAQLTSEQRRELISIGKEVPKAAALIRKKEYDEAGQQLGELRTRIEEIAKAAMMQPSDRAFATILGAIAKQQAVLDRIQGTGDAKPMSFVKDIAPIVSTRCLGCHGADNPRNGLRLDTFAGWKAGGRNGAVLVPSAAARSLIMARVMAPMDQGRMPPNGEALAADEITKIANWINQGAKFDGEAENMVLADLIFQMELKENDVKLPKATGKETVSFTRDIAPWFANLCMNCHSNQRRTSGLSVSTFFDLMKGGDSGAVIIPGDMENSRLFRLVGGLENPRMPQGQARITRKNYDDLVTWFKEGNTFDGADVRTNIATYVRTDAEMAADKFASMTNEDFKAYRTKRSRDQFKRAVPNDEIHEVETDRMFILGNASPARLEQVRDWADAKVAELQKMFNDQTALPWRGRLAIFVMKDRFSYEEFVQTVEGGRAAADRNGHSNVTANLEDAYIVLEDLGDEASAAKPNLHISLIDHLGGAYVKRAGGTPPEWLVRGLGLTLAAAEYPQHAYFRGLEQTAKTIAPSTGAAELFNDGAFSPGTIGGVGYSLTGYMLKTAGPASFGVLLRELSQGKTVDAAMQAAYGSPANVIASAFIDSLK